MHGDSQPAFCRQEPLIKKVDNHGKFLNRVCKYMYSNPYSPISNNPPNSEVQDVYWLTGAPPSPVGPLPPVLPAGPGSPGFPAGPGGPAGPLLPETPGLPSLPALPGFPLAPGCPAFPR